jgi:transposase-like protein
MIAYMDTPRTLLDAVSYFANPDNCLEFLKSRRWPNGVVTCPTCGNAHVRFDRKRRVWECNNRHAKRQFSIKVGTIFEDSPLGLDKWLPTVWMIANCKNGMSSHEIARAIGVTQKTAWFMLHRIRLAMQNSDGGGKLGDDVEVDETYIGGKARNMHAKKRKALMSDRGQHKSNRWAGKVAVMGLLERKADATSRVRTMPLENVRQHRVHGAIAETVEKGTTVYTDALPSYRSMDDFEHKFIDHAEKYVDGQVHTNGLESYWSLLKRALGGTYISVEPFHLFRYLDEQAFRFNNRKQTDAQRFSDAINGIIGRRLTYKDLIAEDAAPRIP